LDVRELITHTFPLELASEAVALAAKPTPESLKVVVVQGTQAG
jgi:threonine dehydrogenase-like Zn-dependent dehydrogenase